MSERKDKDPTRTADDQAPQSSGTGRRSGRVGYDERGNSVWE